jgi:four helix bundle protein
MTRAGQIRSFRDLEVWKLSMDLVVETYAVAMKLPRSEQYELSGQIRRSVVSIPSNIAEGHTRRGGVP